MSDDDLQDLGDHIGAVFDAVNKPLKGLYGDQHPFHLGTMIRWKDGGPDPLDGMSMYWNDDGYWHFVGFGLAEQGIKTSGIPEVSGWGCELTFKLRPPPEVLADTSIDPELNVPIPCLKTPRWPVVMLNDIARYVFSQQAWLRHGHFMQGIQPFPFIGIIADPSLPDPCQTPNGTFHWLQVVILDEEQFAKLQSDDWQAWLASRPDSWHITPDMPDPHTTVDP